MNGRGAPPHAATPDLPVPRSAKGRTTMHALLRAAREVLVRDGYVGSRVSDVSAAAGLSNGAFYRYFTDKKQVMLHVIADFLHSSREYVDVPFDPLDPLDPLSAVRPSAERYLHHWQVNAAVWRAVIEAGQHDPQVEALRLCEIELWCARIAQLLERGVALGTVRRDLDCGMAGALLGQMVDGYAQHAFRPGSGLDTDPVQVAAEVTKLWESGAFVEDSNAPGAAAGEAAETHVPC